VQNQIRRTDGASAGRFVNRPYYPSVGVADSSPDKGSQGPPTTRLTMRGLTIPPSFASQMPPPVIDSLREAINTRREALGGAPHLGCGRWGKSHTAGHHDLVYASKMFDPVAAGCILHKTSSVAPTAMATSGRGLSPKVTGGERHGKAWGADEKTFPKLHKTCQNKL